MINPRLYVWQRSGEKKVLLKQTPIKIEKKDDLSKKRLNASELEEMAKKLDQ